MAQVILENLPLEERLEYIKEQQRRREEKTIVPNEKVRYRCEQLNITKIDDIPRSHSTQKKQYILEFNPSRNFVHVQLEEYFPTINPTVLKAIFEFVKLTEFVRNNVKFELNDSGKIEKVTNRQEIHNNWDNLKKSSDFETEFIKKLRANHPKTVDKIIEIGDKQFSLTANQEEEYRRDLFYFVLFDNYTGMVTDTENKEEFLFRSVLFPEVIIPLEMDGVLKKTDDPNLFIYRKKGKPILTENIINIIKEKYNKIHKADVMYDFTEYYVNFDLNLEWDSISKLPVKANLQIQEGVRNNIENICEYKLRKLS